MNKIIEEILHIMFTNQTTESDENKAELIAKLCMDHAIEAVLHTDYCCKCPYVLGGSPVSKEDVNESIRKAFEASD